MADSADLQLVWNTEQDTDVAADNDGDRDAHGGGNSDDMEVGGGSSDVDDGTAANTGSGDADGNRGDKAAGGNESSIAPDGILTSELQWLADRIAIYSFI